MSFWLDLLQAIKDGTPAGAPPAHVRALAFDKTVAPTKWEDGVAWLRWQADEQFANGNGSVFGGYICAVADVAANFAMMTFLPDDHVHATTDLRMSFFRPIRPGPIDVEARALTRSRTSATIEVEFRDAAGKLCAKATVVEALVKFAPPPAAG